MNYIVLDLEFNQAFPFKSGKKVEPNPECPFEIIQIGAVKLNEHFEQLDSFNCMISPQIYPRLHPFVEKITGIRPKMLAGQPIFRGIPSVSYVYRQEACRSLRMGRG